jgi:hypothetical protein
MDALPRALTKNLTLEQDQERGVVSSSSSHMSGVQFPPPLRGVGSSGLTGFVLVAFISARAFRRRGLGVRFFGTNLPLQELL